MKHTLPALTARVTPAAALRVVGGLLLWAIVGVALISLAYQIPARHVVQVGLNDAAYVQGFSDPLNRWGVIDPATQASAPLRWSSPSSALIFPQIGLPATATIRWRALRTDDEPPPTVRVLLNGTHELGSFAATGEWETHAFAIDGGLWKANDLFVELRTAPTVAIDGVARGVQVDRATLQTSGWPIWPYPAQLVYGTAAIVASAALLRRRRAWQIGAALAIALLFVLLYRLQLTPYPLRTWPPLLALGLVAALALRAAPRLAPATIRVLAPLAALAIVGAWLAWIGVTAREHVTLSLPGVERDFPVFATRATALTCPPGDQMNAPCVLRADGFYNLGYPLLLWLVKPLTDNNAFVAGRIVAAASGGGLLLATWLLARRLLGPGPALIALLVLALSAFVVQYSLYVGTDMPFAALWTAALAALFAPRRVRWPLALLAGVLCGLAFLIRHPGLVLLPFGVLVLVLRGVISDFGFPILGWRTQPEKRPPSIVHRPRSIVLCFVLGWLIAAGPQLVVNVADTGRPFYSQQAKNIWLAVYGNNDFGGRWADASNNVRLSEIVLADPPRFWANWSRNLHAFVGTGANDTSEFGQAIGLRLLGVPANWLAWIGLALWVWRGNRSERLLVVGAALYVIGVSVGFVLPRLFLPLAPLWAIASVVPLLALIRAATRLFLLPEREKGYRRFSVEQIFALAALVLVALLAGGPRIGAGYVLARQDSDVLATIQVMQARLAPSATILFAVPAADPLVAASALAHRAAPRDATDIDYVIWSAASERPAIVAEREPFAVVGPYTLFELR